MSIYIICFKSICPQKASMNDHGSTVAHPNNNPFRIQQMHTCVYINKTKVKQIAMRI